MIIKGGSRAAPSQLAWHLQRRDTNEKIEILELQSPAPSLGEAFRDWQTLVEGTRGSKGLYHANIDPAKDYTMTREQWQRSVDVLEKELGLEGQPRAIIMHEKHGREHIHVVWARTDIDRMIVRSDSQNYLAHERASMALEQEFGHEHVPGKHAKRDRDKQPEFPKAEANQAEWQQGERTGIDPAARKDQITALKQSCDNGQAFKTALEEQGYILAKGDRRDFVIVDETGSIHSLGRQIRDLKAADLRKFMERIDRAALPSAAEAVDYQRQRAEEHLRQKYEEPESRPEEKQPQHIHQHEPSNQMDDIDREEQLRRQHQAPEPPHQQEYDEHQRRQEGQRSETSRRYSDQPDIDGLGAIIEVAVTPLTEALRAILDYRSAGEREFPDEQARQRKQAASAQTPRRYPNQPDIDGLGAIIEVAVTPLTEALRAILDYHSGGEREFPNEEARQRQQAASAQTPRRYSKQPDIDGLGAIIEVAVTPLTEALRAFLDYRSGGEREFPNEEARQRQQAAPAETPRRYSKQPDIDGLGAIIEVAVTPLTEALRAILDYRSSGERELLNEEARQRTPAAPAETPRPNVDGLGAIPQEQTEAARREQRELSTALTRFFGAIQDVILPDRAIRRQDERQQEKPEQQKLEQKPEQEKPEQEKLAKQKPEQEKPEQQKPAREEQQEHQPEEQQEHQRQEEKEQRDQGHQQQETPKPAESVPDPIQAETEALKKAVAERQTEERRQIIQAHTDEMKRLRDAIALDTEEKLDRFDATQQAEVEARARRQEKQALTGVAEFISSVQDFFQPARAAERKAERQREDQQFVARQKQERDDYAALLQKTNELEIQNVTERHELRLDEHAARGEEELDRYIRELESARVLQAEVEERQRAREEELARDGPERPPPRRAR